MTLEHVAGTGRARLGAATFEALTTRADLPPDLAALVDVVRNPTSLLSVEVGGADGRLLHQGWVTPEGATLLLDLGDGRYDLFGVAAQGVPAAIARVGRLGPRKATERVPRSVVRQELAALWQDDVALRAAALEALGGSQDRWAWRAELAWSTDALRATGRSVTAVAGPEGWWLARAEDDDEVTLIPTTPTALWWLLIALLPTDRELEQIRSLAHR